MITALNNVQLNINIEVKFTLKSLVDKQVWRGRIIGVCGFDVAMQYNDVVATHNNMPAAVAKQEPVSLTYILLKCTDGQIRPFATAWINESEFERTDNVTDVTVIIHNVTDTSKAKILTEIRDLGFEVTVM